MTRKKFIAVSRDRSSEKSFSTRLEAADYTMISIDRSIDFSTSSPPFSRFSFETPFARERRGGGKVRTCKAFQGTAFALNWQIAFNRIAPRFPRSDFKTSSFLTFSPDLDLPLAGRTNVELYLLCSLFSNLSFRCSFYGRNVKFHLG